MTGMNINIKVMEATGGLIIPVMLGFLGESIMLMIPWFITMFTIICTDLAAGVWKSYKLQIPIRISKAFRDTMGKMIVYFAFVIMICCINVALKGEFDFAKWSALFVIVIEGGSIISNLLKTHGINLSLNALIKAFVTHSAFPITCPEADEIFQKEDLKDIRKEELEKIKEEESNKKQNKKNNGKK